MQWGEQNSWIFVVGKLVSVTSFFVISVSSFYVISVPSFYAKWFLKMNNVGRIKKDFVEHFLCQSTTIQIRSKNVITCITRNIQMLWSVSCLRHWSQYLIRTEKVDWIQCDQIGRFIGLWATFKSLCQQLACPNLPHS